jgi:glyoxylase-like metal-dependent hydrolase (beta-lactamase superfamily II)
LTLVQTLTAGLSYIDLGFLGRPHAIATVVVSGSGRIALIDPGPTSCLSHLEQGLQSSGIRLSDLSEIVLTHIHLDHAGATGTILRRHPDIEVIVHRRGAPHLIAPEKLVESARRLWGDDMDRLWGEVAPVPERQLRIVDGEEQINAGGRTFEVAYTPGHASHHVSYFDAASGIAFVGDTAGVCIDRGYVLPPTPPPDIDLELWRASVERVERWQPASLFMTHFGPAQDVRPHFAELLDHLDVVASLVRASLDRPGTDDERSVAFAEELRRELRRKMPEAQVAAYETAAQFHLLWRGLARYWRKKST